MRFLFVLFKYLLVVILCLWLVVPCASSDVLCLSGENHPKLRRRNESFTNRAVADAAQARAHLSPTVFLGTLKSVLVQRDGTVRAWFAIDNLLKMPHTGEDRSKRIAARSVKMPHTDDDDRNKRIARMANYTRLYERNRYTSVHQYASTSVPAVRLKNSSLDYTTRAAVKRVPLTINTLNWTVSDPPLLLGSFRRTTRTLNRRPEDTEVVYYRHGKCVLEVNQDNLRLGGQYVVFGVPSDRQTWPSLTASALPIPNDKRILRAVQKVLCKGCAKPPSIEGLQNVKVEEGSKARLRCHLAGNPIPWVEWFKDGKKITTRGRIRVKTKRRTSRLVIRRARISDRGVYQCRAGNVVQTEPVSARAAIVVTRKSSTTPPHLSTSTSTQSSPWTTETCRETNFCNNGGTCVFYKDVREYVCHCADGYVGLRCDFKDVRVSVGEVKNYNSRGAIP